MAAVEAEVALVAALAVADSVAAEAADLVEVITAPVVFTAARVAPIIADHILDMAIITVRAFLAGGDPDITATAADVLADF